ncbi:hypothetical protein HMPREF0578_0457 [Mobiluncus mulieris 28-1]|nr:hypothetical protein HMPREF0578_0457 [Mobiluncus mulieris 28-1]
MSLVSVPWQKTVNILVLRGKFLAKRSFFTHFCQMLSPGSRVSPDLTGS